MDEYRIEGINVYPELAADPTDAILDSLDASGAIDAVASVSLPTGFVTAMFTLDADSPDEASVRAAKMLEDAFTAAEIPARLARLCVDAADAVEALEGFERTVCAADIARARGLTRERVRQLTRLGDFPAPVERLGKSALYRWHEVRAFFERREAHTARPSSGSARRHVAKPSGGLSATMKDSSKASDRH